MLVEFPNENKKVPENLASRLYRWRFPILSGVLLFLLASFAMARYGLQERRNIQDFFQVGVQLNELKKGEEVDRSQLNALIQSHPEIGPLLDHYLIEDYFLSGDSESGRQAGENSLKRISYVNPLYHDFVKTSFLIENEGYEEALAQARDLEKRIPTEAAFARLKFFNLLRIGMLEKNLGIDLLLYSFDPINYFL